jgi:uncharacterized membrane protein YfcA
MSIFELISTNWELILSFFTVAILYASVGFGGGSSYLAILALAAILSYTEIRSTSLLCNIVVVSNSFILYYKNGYYKSSKVLPLIITSIPLAFLGGYLRIDETLFFLLLGATLLIASILIFISKKTVTESKTLTSEKKNITQGATYGGAIGFLSGMVGIGGGIFLAPLLHLTKWDTPKKIAATASLFILVNSIAGLSGQMLNPNFCINVELTLLLVSTTLIGGQIGTRLSIKHIKPLVLKKTTAILIAFVALKILFKYI